MLEHIVVININGKTCTKEMCEVKGSINVETLRTVKDKKCLGLWPQWDELQWVGEQQQKSSPATEEGTQVNSISNQESYKGR